MVFFLYFPFVLIFKITRFGVMCHYSGFGGLLGRVFLILAMWTLNMAKAILIMWLLAIYWNEESGLCN